MTHYYIIPEPEYGDEWWLVGEDRNGKRWVVDVFACDLEAQECADKLNKAKSNKEVR